MTITQSSVVFALALFTPVNSQSVGNGCVVGVDCAPPMGWRSWNTYGGDVTQALMEAVMDAMAATSYNGESFFSLGIPIVTALFGLLEQYSCPSLPCVYRLL